MNVSPKTIFCDIDGCLVFHHGKGITGQMKNEPIILEGVIDKLLEWDTKGYTVILTTGRPESMRDMTIKQLESLGIWWHHLIMNLPRGERVVINDIKLNGDRVAVSVNINRNEGLNGVDV